MRWDVVELFRPSFSSELFFFGSSWVNVLLREENMSNYLEYREDLGLFQEEQPSQMGTIFLVTESKQGIIREEPYQFRITLFSLLQATMHLCGSVTTLLMLGGKGGREWLHAMFQQPFFGANNGQQWIFIANRFSGKFWGVYFILDRNEPWNLIEIKSFMAESEIGL